MKQNGLNVLIYTFCYSPNVGGIERHLESLVHFLIQNGCHCTIVTNQFDSTLNYEVFFHEKIYRFGPITPKVYIKNLFDFHLFFKRELIKLKTIESLKKDCYDVVYVILFNNWMHSWGIPITPKFVWSSMTKKIGCNSVGWINGVHSKWVKQPRKLIYYFNELRELNEADFLIPTEDYMLDLYAHYLAHIPYRKIYAGIDTSFFKPLPSSILKKNMGFSDNEKIVAYVGRVEKQKGAIEYLNIMKKLSLLNKRVTGLVVGNGSLRPYLQTCASGLGIKLHFTGSVDPYLVRNYLNVADVVVFPFQFEGIGIASLEAMACAKAIVKTKVGKYSYPFKMDFNALLYSPNDLATAVNQICSLLDDASLQEKLGNQARATVMHTFNVNLVNATIYDLLKRNSQ